MLIKSIQIGINLSDPVFSGEYHGKKVHDSDLDDIIERARSVGCLKFMVTGSDLEESRRAIAIARKYRKHIHLSFIIFPNNRASWLLLWNSWCPSLRGKGL